MIYHITNRTIWDNAVKNNSFRTESLGTEGFIHCSPGEKILDVANNFYKDKKDLLLLNIDESRVSCKIVWEDLYGHGYEFPHIYGELNLDAVTGVSDLTCGEDGLFIFPEFPDH